MRQFSCLARFLLPAALFFCTMAGLAYGQGQTAPAAPGFSHAGGFHAVEFSLQLLHDDPEVAIFYTLDGSRPDPANTDGSSYRYKNSYQQPPEQPVDNFLHQSYRTYRYAAPIEIRDRTLEPDRLARISTTFDSKPAYFPEPRATDAWENIPSKAANAVIDGLNLARNRASSLWHEFRKGSARLKYEQYFPHVPYPDKEYLYKGTVVRAIAVRETAQGAISSDVATSTFFIGDPRRYQLPVIAITVPEKLLFDYDEGAFVAGADYDSFLADGKDVSGARHHRPANWRRPKTDMPAHIEIFESGPAPLVSADVALRIHGNSTRAARNKSMRLIARKKYGTSDLQHNFFPGQGAARQVRINLRNGGNGTQAKIADIVAHQVSSGLGMGVQRYAPYVVFLNGEYYGLLTARDRKDSHYLQEVYGLPGRKVDLLENDGAVETGDDAAWQQFMAQALSIDRDSPAYYGFLSAHVDVTSAIDYYAASIFFARTNWPGNNMAYWRYRQVGAAGKFAGTDSGDPGDSGSSTGTDEGRVSGASDGRWRWLLYDVDDAFKEPDHDTLQFATMAGGDSWPNPDWSTRLLRTMLENPQFAAQFISRYSDLLNSYFLPERVAGIIRSVEAGYEAEMPEQIHRWSTPDLMEVWHASVDQLVRFAELRPAVARKNLQDYFALGDLYTLDIAVRVQGDQPSGLEAAGSVRVNSLTLGAGLQALPVAASGAPVGLEPYISLPWSGRYFSGQPIVLQAEPAPGYRFSHWELVSDQENKGDGRLDPNKPRITLAPASDTKVVAVLKAED